MARLSYVHDVFDLSAHLKALLVSLNRAAIDEKRRACIDSEGNAEALKGELLRGLTFTN